MHPSFDDIERELRQIAREVEHLEQVLARPSAAAPASGSQAEWEATHICASAAEKIYTGCERVMARIASIFDTAPLKHGDGWHATLLRRMAQKFPDSRGPVISSAGFAALDALRAFRHRERNTYGFDLDDGLVVARSGQAAAAFTRFRADVEAFFART
jgi:hypothetical protein